MRQCLGSDIEPADVLLLATAPWSDTVPPLLRTVGRGCADERVVRLCVTAAMAALIEAER